MFFTILDNNLTNAYNIGKERKEGQPMENEMFDIGPFP
jgi:hypothetical protein